MDTIARSAAPLTAVAYAAIVGVVMSLLIAMAVANRLRNALAKARAGDR